MVRHEVHPDFVPLLAERGRADRPAGRLRQPRCEFTRDNPLPILAVDEPIYRRLPCFLIATVDKFAGLPWVGEAGAFFGRVERYDRRGGLLRPEPSRGAASRSPAGRLPPPDLIIQDELHLISGPLGTMVGCTRRRSTRWHARSAETARSGPKIVASTATVRRAPRARSGRCSSPRDVEVFPPPGPDRRDSFFAHTVGLDAKRNARLYLGVAAQGRSLKVVLLLRTCRACWRRRRRPTRGGRRRVRAEPGRPLHDAARLLQQPARAGRQPAHRRGRGERAD